MKERALQILLVEDNAGDARLLREMFSTEKPGSFELTQFLRMSEAMMHLEKAAWTSSCWTWDCRMHMVSTQCGERATFLEHYKSLIDGWMPLLRQFCKILGETLFTVMNVGTIGSHGSRQRPTRSVNEK